MYGYDDAAGRVSSGEVDYLAKAAEQLAKVAASIDRSESSATFTAAYRDERKQLADQYATLGAIQRGQIPASLARELLDRITAERG